MLIDSRNGIKSAGDADDSDNCPRDEGFDHDIFVPGPDV
jgi:hypothetical protein